MLDDLRNSASTFVEEEQSPNGPGYTPEPPKKQALFLGMTAPQRFVISLMLFMMTCVVGVLALVVLEKMVIPLPF